MVELKKRKRAQEDKKVAEQPELFGSRSRLHDVILEHGSLGAVQEADKLMLEDSPPPLAKVLSSERGRHIADTALSALTREAEGAVVPGYSYSAWSLAGLPHKDLPPGDPWVIDTGFARLLVKPGFMENDAGQTRTLRVPSGMLARLLLIDMQTEVTRTGSPVIEMGSSAASLLARLGVKRGGQVSARLIDQLERLATCGVSFRFGNDKSSRTFNGLLVRDYKHVENPDPRAASRMIQEVTLSDAFFREMRAHPVLVDKAALHELTGSAMAIDIYLWLAFRLPALQEEIHVPWERLRRQFGARVGQMKNFKPQFEAPLYTALSVYPRNGVEVRADGLLLRPSPPPTKAT